MRVNTWVHPLGTPMGTRMSNEFLRFSFSFLLSFTTWDVTS